MSLASGGSLKKELSQAEKSVHISCHHRFHLDGYDMSWRTVLSEVNLCWGHLSRHRQPAKGNFAACFDPSGPLGAAPPGVWDINESANFYVAWNGVLEQMILPMLPISYPIM